ncbi:hypothetical protein IAR50_000280 [Cryptococcus sp. DSM 104548]
METITFSDLVKGVRREDDPPVRHLKDAMGRYIIGNNLGETESQSCLSGCLTPAYKDRVDRRPGLRR